MAERAKWAKTLAHKWEEPWRPLTPAQRASAARYSLYRTWLLRSGRTEAEIDGQVRS